MAPVEYGPTETVQHLVSQSAESQNAAPVLHSVPVQLPAPASQQSCGDTGTISYAGVSVYSRVEVVIQAWIRWRPNRPWRQ